MFLHARKSASSAPDFAYPQQVMKNADEQLDKALKKGDGQLVIQSLIQSGLAQVAVSPDAIPSVIKRIETISSREKDAATRALLDLLLADIYTQYYNSDSYDLDHRTALATPGDDITLWSGKEFKARIMQLYADALSQPDELKKKKLENYCSVINIESPQQLFYPTLFDFASAHALEGISGLDAISMSLLSPIYLYDIQLRIPNVMSKPSQQAMAVANAWVAADDGAPLVAALLNRYEYVKNFVVADDGSNVQDALVKMYRDHIDIPYSVEFLLAQNFYNLPQSQRKVTYTELKTFKERYPGYFNIEAVNNALNKLAEMSCTVAYPSQVALNRDFEMQVILDNMKDVDLLVYRVKNSAIKPEYSRYRLIDCESQPVARLHVTSDSIVPFSDTQKVKYSFDKYGVYIIVSGSDDKRSYRHEPIHCSDLALVDTHPGSEICVYSVNGVNGHPVEGVEITSIDNSGNSPRNLRTHITGDDGLARLQPGSLRNILIHAAKGADIYSPALNEYIHRYSPEYENTTAFVRTSLAIYHPGDTLDFVAVVYKYNGDSRELVKNGDFKATLRNTNYVDVDTIDIVTDEYGRAKGSFAIPEDGLTGYYSVIITGPKTRNQIAWQRVMVSDYKLPTYEAKVDSVEINEADGSVTIRGNAMTYSGFPVQNAVVEASLSGLQRHWWLSNSVEFHTDTLTTDVAGSFRWTLPKAVLDENPYPAGRFRADFTVTSSSGENRQCSREFSLSKTPSVTIETGNYIEAVADADVHISVNDALGNPLDAALKLTFKNDSVSVYDVDAQCANGITKADLSMLHSGTYRLTAAAVGTDAQPAEAEVVVYNAADANSPVDSPLWAPKSVYSVDKFDRKCEIVYAVPRDGANVLLTTSCNDNIINEKWLKPAAGINRVNVTVPDTVTNINVRLALVDSYRAYEKSFTVKVSNPDEVLKVKIERMRDHLTPLTGETVTVKVTNGAGRGVGAAVILDMYSKALDNLATQSWQFVPQHGYAPSLSFSDNLTGNQRYSFSTPVSFISGSVAESIPDFNYYGRSWEGYASGMMYMKYAAPVAMRSSSGALGGAEMMNDVMEAESVYAVNEMADTVTVEEAEAEDAGASDEAKAGAADEKQYRPAEVPLAFFAPMLSTDNEGNLTYSFTVPDANTTWVLNALSYTGVLATATDIREVVASKPVMVEPNMPRFLRTGDKAQIRAVVMNASNSEAVITTSMEIADPASGDKADSRSVVSHIAAGESATVTFDIAAPASEGALIVRVMSSTESYSDGVQTLLPILSSSQPVIESEVFYMSPDQKELTRGLPAAASGTRVTLSFCENPTWEVVSALPGLRSDDAKTSLAASAQIFAASVSRYILDLNPAIEPALKEWLASAKSSGEMLSMLNRNDDLKQLYLAATPWVQQAQSDEERMARLAILFDRKEIDRSIKSAVASLRKMQRSNGGWSWTMDYDMPSEWVTMMILNNFAELRQIGCSPAEIDAMVKNAWGYVDAEVGKDYQRYPKGDYRMFTYIRSLYTDIPMPTSAKKAYNATVQRIIKDWKKSSTPQKAADALVLYRNDYKNVAADILSSLREFATSTPELGMWWDSVDGSSWWALTSVGQTAFILQAFNTIDPGCPEIDKIRQWLILNKIVQDWGTSVDASACVASILQCGSDWLNRPGDAVVTVDGAKINPDKFDKLTGQIIAQIPNAKGDLQITRSVEGPAWGAVVQQSTQVMKDVKAHSIPELSVSKDIFVKTSDGWAETDNFAVGQVAKVRLVIKSQRDMDYVTVVDNRAAAFEPAIQTPRPVYCDGLVFYLENRDAATNLFIDHLPKGQYVIEYEMNVNNAGTFASGLATIQSQYTPEMTAHSAGSILEVK